MAPYHTIAMDTKLLAQAHWELAVVVYGSSDAAHKAGCEPYDSDHDAKNGDLSVYCAYVGEVKKCLADPEVETSGSAPSRRIDALVGACRAFAPLHLKQPQFMQEVATADLDSLAKMDNLASQLAEQGRNGDCDFEDYEGGGDRGSEPDTAYHSNSGELISGRGSGESVRSRSTRHGSRKGSGEGNRPPSLICRDPGTPGIEEEEDADDHDSADEAAEAAARVPPGANAAVVLEAIGMTPDQEETLLKEFKLVRADLTAIEAQRTQAITALRLGDSAASEQLMSLNLREGTRKADFLIWYTHKVLSALGHAKMDAASFPFSPDPIGLGNELLKRKAVASAGSD